MNTVNTGPSGPTVQTTLETAESATRNLKESGRSHTETSGAENSNPESSWTPYAHQIEAIRRGREGSLALFHEPGCGKTFSALQLIRHHKLYSMGGFKALVVCPLSIIESAWIEDCRKFTPELKAVSLHCRKPEERLARLNGDADIHVINFEGFRGLYDALVAQRYHVLVVDESSKMKNPQSETAKALLTFAGIKAGRTKYKGDWTVPYRYVLSGTPAPNSLEEYWTQITFIAPRQAFPSSFYAFRGKFFEVGTGYAPGGRRFKKWTFREYMRQEFMDAMKPFAHIVRKADAVDLPEQIHEIRTVYLDHKEQAAYNAMRESMRIEYADKSAIALNAIGTIMKLRQITSGFAYCMDGVGETGTIQIGKSKLAELKELLEELGAEQVIVWCNFQDEVEQLTAELKCPALWSGTKDRDEVIEGFKAGRYQYLVANPQTAGHGLTFTNCRYAVYYSLNYSYELWKQSMDRIHRIGQHWPCTYYYLIAADTIDKVIYDVLHSKRDLSDAVLEYLKGDPK